MTRSLLVQREEESQEEGAGAQKSHSGAATSPHPLHLAQALPFRLRKHFPKPMRLRESSNFYYSTYLKLKLQATKVTSNYTLDKSIIELMILRMLRHHYEPHNTTYIPTKSHYRRRRQGPLHTLVIVVVVHHRRHRPPPPLSLPSRCLLPPDSIVILTIVVHRRRNPTNNGVPAASPRPPPPVAVAPSPPSRSPMALS